MTESATLEGGCHCGAVRYRLLARPTEIFHCHCSICRRSGAAPFLTWAGVAAENLEIVKGSPHIHASSEDGRRGFCPSCGTQLTFAFESAPGTVYVTAGSLDDPAAVTPTDHWFIADSVRWLHVDDGLPRHDAFPNGWSAH